MVDFLTCLTKFLFDTDPLSEFWPCIEDHFNVYKPITIQLKAIHGFKRERRERASPKEGGHVSSKFNTVLVHEDEQAGLIGIEGVCRYQYYLTHCILILNSGYCIAQVQAFFILPCHIKFNKPLAYIEYFLPFTSQQQGTDLYSVH